MYSLRNPIIMTNKCVHFLNYFKPSNVVVSVTRLRSGRTETMGSIPSRDEGVRLPFRNHVHSASRSSCCLVSTGGLYLVLKLPVHDNWVPVNTVWLVLRWRIEEQTAILRVAANILNKQSRTADRGCPPAWGLRVANDSSP